MLGVIAEQEIGTDRSIDWNARLDDWVADAETRFGPIVGPLPCHLLVDLGMFIRSSTDDVTDDNAGCNSDVDDAKPATALTSVTTSSSTSSSPSAASPSQVASAHIPALRPTSSPRRYRVNRWRQRVQKLYSPTDSTSLLYVFATMSSCPVPMVPKLMQSLSPRFAKALSLLEARTLLHCCDAIESVTALQRAVVAFATYADQRADPARPTSDVLFPEPFRVRRQLYAFVKEQINHKHHFLRRYTVVAATVRRSGWTRGNGDATGNNAAGRGQRVFADQLVAFGVEPSTETLFSTGGQVGRQDVITWTRKESSKPRYGTLLAILVVDLKDENGNLVPVACLVVERLYSGRYDTGFPGYIPVFHNHYDPKIQVLLIGQTPTAAIAFPPPFLLSRVDLVPDRTLATANSRDNIIQDAGSPSFFSFYLAKIS